MENAISHLFEFSTPLYILFEYYASYLILDHYISAMQVTSYRKHRDRMIMDPVQNQNPEILSVATPDIAEVDESRNDGPPSSKHVADDQCEILNFETLNTAPMSEEDLLRVARYDNSVFQHALLILKFFTYKTLYAT